MFNNVSEFYRSTEWAEFRRIYLNTHDMVCSHCGHPIVLKYDAILHHKTELTEDNVHDYNVSLNEDNIELVHHHCHNEIHERFGSHVRHVYLVYGAPGAGKTTFARESAGRNDLIVDMDSIYQAISNNNRYIKPDTLKANAFAVRDCLLDSIRVRHGKWHNAYIIGGYPRVGERERLCTIYGAEEIYIQMEKEECYMRCFDRPGWKKFIDKWFEDYTPPTSENF